MPHAGKGGKGKGKGNGGGKSKAIVARMMKEVHENVPSTVKRAKHFGPGGPEAMKRAIAMSKAREAGARVRRVRSA